MTKWKNSKKEGLMTWKIEQLTLFIQKEGREERERKKKREGEGKPTGLMEHNEKKQYSYYGSSGKKGERDRKYIYSSNG